MLEHIQCNIIQLPMTLKIVHYTHKDNLPKILASGMIFDQLRRNKKNIKVGEGDLSRTCCYPTNTYNSRPEKCNEGCGLFFRVLKPGQKLKKPFNNHVAMVFNVSILSRYKWHINFCENNGLWIDDGVAYLGDGDDTCPNSSNKIKDIMATEFDQASAEIIVYDSIDLRDLDYIVDRNMESVPFVIKSRSKSKSRSKKSRNSVNTRSRSKILYSRRTKTV
jgi:hypothetical protein